MARVLFVGESWSTVSFNLKGFSIYTAGEYEEGGTPLIEALANEGHEVEYLRSHEVATRYPKSVDELSAYDTVVFSDVGADTFLLRPDTLRRSLITNNPLADVCAYVEKGGGFLMVGGYLSFSGFAGNACYPNTPIADILPVEMIRGDDRIERPEGVNPSVAAQHPVVDGIPAEWPPFLGYQKLVARPGTTTVLTAGDDPFLVLGEHGRGRVAAFASDCSPHWGTPQFVSWDHYASFWGRLVGWLSGARG